jgi:hypothetical protein
MSKEEMAQRLLAQIASALRTMRSAAE